MSLAPQRILQAVEEGRITEREADYYLRCVHGIALAQARETSAPVAGPRDFTSVEAPHQQPLMPPSAAVGATPAATGSAGAASSVSAAPLRRTAIYTLAVFCLLGLTSMLYLAFSQTGAAGYLTLDLGDLGQSNGTNSSFPIPYEITGMNVSGVLYGEGEASVHFDTAQRSYIVARITSDNGAPRTASPSYAEGKSVEIEHAPAGATYYLDDGVTLVPVEVPFPAPAANRTLLIIANASGDLATFRVPILIGDFRRQTRFESVCDETCTLEPSNGSLHVYLVGEVFLNVTAVDIVTGEPNRAPRLAIQIPTQTINATIATIDLGLYFVDPDGDEISYTVGASDLVNATIDGALLTMTPLAAGNGTLVLYASDLHELVTERIDIVVTATAGTVGEAGNGTGDGTGNGTSPAAGNQTPAQDGTPDGDPAEAPDVTTDATPGDAAQNASSDTTQDGTGTPANGSGALDCSNPDPNARPAGCLDADAAKYFEEDILLENTDRAKIARITSLGNLILRGRVYARDASGRPGPRDFVIGHKDADFNYVPTVWIDSLTGDLHLRGALHEENPSLQPSGGSYTIMNRRGVYLLYAERGTGDMYVRGNVIMYREDVDG